MNKRMCPVSRGRKDQNIAWEKPFSCVPSDSSLHVSGPRLQNCPLCVVFVRDDDRGSLSGAGSSTLGRKFALSDVAFACLPNTHGYLHREVQSGNHDPLALNLRGSNQSSASK